jgi:hypothetical protein
LTRPANNAVYPPPILRFSIASDGSKTRFALSGPMP